jgi:hypothetical protein
MATVYGIQTTRRRNTLPVRLVEQGYQGGNVKVLEDKYTFTADLASGDFISMGILPAGARVIDVRVAFDDLDTTGGTIDIGWFAGAAGVEAADDDGFGANVDVATAAGVYSMWTSQRTRPGFAKVFSEAVEVAIKIDGDTDVTTGDVFMQVLYVVD